LQLCNKKFDDADSPLMSNIRSIDIEPSDSRFSPGEQGKYRVIASLGQGGMANIYLAVMSGPARFSKLLVLKVLREDLDANQDELVTMFLDEARLAARLQHRNIVQTYEFGEVDGRYHMAMEYLEGQPMRALQRKIAPAGLPMAEELYVLAEAARGLHYAHELKGFDGTPMRVVHRDVSPQNVFVTFDGEVKLLDFGIAKTEGAEHLTKVGVIKGKVDYIAPEQARGDDIDRRADIFSLGAMLWEAVTKQRFAGGAKVLEVTKFHRRLTGGEANVRVAQPDVPEAVASIVDRAIALDPKARFASAEEFASSIETYLATLPVRPSQRSLSELLHAHFHEERTRLSKLIEQQVQVAQERGKRTELSTSQKLDLTMTMSGVLDLSAPGSAPRPRQQLAGSASADAELPQRVKRKPAALAAAGVLVAALAGWVLSTASTGPAPITQPEREPAPAAQPQGATAPTPAPEPERSREREIKLTVAVMPADARVTLDGAPLPQLPFVGDFRMSGSLHHLEASAEGYQTVRQLVSFDQDRDIKIVLVASAAPARTRVKRSSASSSGDSSAPAPVAAPSPQAGKPGNDSVEPGADLQVRRRTRNFDTTNPYAD
jgi:serine/threonine protein kinase